ncbi:Protein TIFY 5A [Abeliophyllum distichum]|uniref:Protein TIFY n=1 Tax=Abeliophyllum distichum TaxID=126358 RepID=A0ABD1QFK3_9LAMI
MKRNCNLELRLVTPSVLFHADRHYQPMSNMVNESPNEEQHQQLTIFYNGNVAVCNVTEFQARLMILLARREMEERSPGSDPCSPLLQSPSPLHSPIGLCMKRSLQRFLQKRKTRIQATPYHR